MRTRMRPARAPLLAIVLTLASPAAPATARGALTAADSLASVLPQGAVVVDVLTPDYTKRVEELAVRINAAAREHPQWFQAYMREHAGAPPWHPNFGVTPAEYREYVSAARTATWRVRERATLTFERATEGRRWTLHGWGVLDPLEGVVIDLETMTVRSRKGMLPFLGIAAPQRDEGALDWRWFGSWKASHRIGDPAHGGQALDVGLHLGPLADGRHAALYWTSRRANNGRRLEDQFLLLRFAIVGG